MRTRATGDLNSLSDNAFFAHVAEGMEHCVRNACSLLRDARFLGRDQRFRSANVMLAFGHEEIAKYLILLDAVRCPRTEQKTRVTQLRRFSDHLAKGLYIELYDGSPATFGEVRKRADAERAEFFLDGPNDVDWIFRNSILAHREQSIYVDFVKTDEGSRWERPRSKSWGGSGIVSYRSAAHQVVLAMHAAGFTNPHSLEEVAKVWRGLKFADDTHWETVAAANRETLKSLQQAGLLRSASDLVVRTIVGKWSFPFYDLDLSPRDVSLDELRQRQADWSPGW